MPKYVGVKHDMKSENIYWFETPGELNNIAHIGSHIVCDTKIGRTSGTIVQIIEDLEMRQVHKIIPQRYFPLSRIIGIETEYNIEDIYIAFDMERDSFPEPDEIAKRMREFFTTGRFGDVIFKPDGTLLSGYSAYLVAKMLGHDSLKGIVVSDEEE